MDDMKFLTRCLQLANAARGRTAPNPLVGAVIVHNGTIIGEGFHHKAGQPHAEVNAIASVNNKELLSSSTLYCSLEPCSHFGKTPPCCELITAHGIPRVVIGTLDPHEQVDGKGVEHLRKHGVEVILANDPSPFQRVNDVFWTNKTQNRPHITLKWAQSVDGFMDAERSETNTSAALISGPLAGINTHKLRAEVQGIVIGAKTAQWDSPSLTTRHWNGPSPRPIILCSQHWQPNRAWLNSLAVKPLLIDVQKHGDFETLVADPYDLRSWIPQLINHEIFHVLVEGGSQILSAFMRADLADHIIRYTSKDSLGNGVSAPILDRTGAIHQLGSDRYEH